MTSFADALTTLIHHSQLTSVPAEDLTATLQAAIYRLGAKPRPCRICGASILIGKGHHSKNRQFCSNRCKLRSRQQKKDNAS